MSTAEADMLDKILSQMKRGVYYPGHHLGTPERLDQLVAQGYLERMEASFLWGPDNEPAYRLSDRGCRETTKADGQKKQRHETSR